MKSNFSMLAVLTVSLLSSCAISPGLHLGRSLPAKVSVDTSAEVDGLRLELRRLSPEVTASVRRAASAKLTLPSELANEKVAAYRIGLYDVVTVAVWEHPELSMPLGQFRTDDAAGQTVDEQGRIFYPYAGLLDVAGLTTSDLRKKLLESLSRVLNNPQLDVKVTAFRSQRVFIHGAVARPGSIPVRDVPLTLLDAINQAGGILPAGNASQVELTRGNKTWTVNLYGDYERIGPSQLLLRDGDVLRIASRDEGKVYVLGEVVRPAALPMENGKLTLVQALAEVGGLAPLSAKGRGIYVIRNTDSARVQVFHLDARDPLALAVGDLFPLKPRDIVFVDATGLARWNRVVGLILPTAQLYYNAALGLERSKSLTE